jgi:hypothetical protein
VFKLPVKLKGPLVAAYSSALAKIFPLLLTPPATSATPLVSSVAVWLARAVFKLPLKAKPVVVKVVEPPTVPETAVIVVTPTLKALARPCDPDVLLIVPTLAAEELQVTVVVRFCVLPSL